MSNKKITELDDIGVPDNADILEIVDVSTNTSKHVKVDKIKGDLSSLKREVFTWTSGAQNFVLSSEFNQVYLVDVQGQGALHPDQYSVTFPNIVTILDTLDVGDYITVLYSASPVGIPAFYTQAETDNLLSFKEDKSNKSNSFTVSSIITYPNTKALVDGLATKQNALGYTAENNTNKSDDIETNKTSSVIYSSAKGIVIWIKEFLMSNLTAKTSLVDSDTVIIGDSADSNKTKKITFINLKLVLKSYFDGIYENVFNKSDSFTVSSSTTYASTKALVDGLAALGNYWTLTGSNTQNATNGTVIHKGASTGATKNTSFRDSTNLERAFIEDSGNIHCPILLAETAAIVTLNTGYFADGSSAVRLTPKRTTGIDYWWEANQRIRYSGGALTEALTANDLIYKAYLESSSGGATTNATTTALTLATLNSTYSTQLVGFRVICMAISGGALIYTKTGASTWCSSSVTNVT